MCCHYITTNEVVYAGGFGGTANYSYYLRNEENFWTLTPFSYDGASRIMIVGDSGSLNYKYPYDNLGLRPVISIRSDTTFTFIGTGTKGSMTNP